MKWKEILSANAISESSLPAKIRKSITAFNELVAERQDLEKRFNDEETDEEKQNLQEELDSISEDINSIDEGLCIEIQKLAQKPAKKAGKTDEEKAAFAQKMKDAKAAKKAATVVEPEPNPQPSPEPNPEPNPQPSPEPNPEPNPQPSPEPNPEPNDGKGKDKKDDGFGLGSVLLGVGLFALTLGTYNYFKNR